MRRHGGWPPQSAGSRSSTCAANRTATPTDSPTRLWTPHGDRRGDPAGRPPVATIGRQQVRMARGAKAGVEDPWARNALVFELPHRRGPAVEEPAVVSSRGQRHRPVGRRRLRLAEEPPLQIADAETRRGEGLVNVRSDLVAARAD